MGPSSSFLIRLVLLVLLLSPDLSAQITVSTVSPSPSPSPRPSESPFTYPSCDFIGSPGSEFFATIRVSSIPDQFEGDLLVAYRTSANFVQATNSSTSARVVTQLTTSIYHYDTIDSSDMIIPHQLFIMDMSDASPINYIVQIQNSNGGVIWQCNLVMYIPPYDKVPEFPNFHQPLEFAEQGMGGGAGTTIMQR